MICMVYVNSSSTCKDDATYLLYAGSNLLDTLPNCMAIERFVFTVMLNY